MTTSVATTGFARQVEATQVAVGRPLREATQRRRATHLVEASALFGGQHDQRRSDRIVAHAGGLPCQTGVVEGHEHEMVESVFRLGDRHVADVMTPRTQLEWVDASERPDAIRAQMVEQSRSRFLVCDGSVDNILGVAHAEDLLVQCLSGEQFDVRAVLWQPLYVPATMPALRLLEQFRMSRQHVAIALDEFGGLQGVVVLDDLVEAVVGELPAHDESPASPIERIDDHTWAVQGSVPLEDVELTLDLTEIPAEVRRGVRTLGGFVMTLLGRVTAVGDVVEWDGLRMRVNQMDGRRIVRVVLMKLPAEHAGDVIPPGDAETTK